MATIFCDYCQHNISGLFIRCVECIEYDLCLQCFSCGVESGEHRKEHQYQVENVTSSVAFEIDQPWSLAEEHMLLDAVEQYGLGNWEDVAGHVETRTAADCEEHFTQYYITGNIGKATFPSELGSRIEDYSCPEGGPVSPSGIQPLPPLELSLQEQHVLGFMPLRNDFEREYNNGAESLISGLAIHPDDDELDIDVKLCCISKYRMQLRERVRRKKIARDHRLISTSMIPSKNGKMPTPKRKFMQEDREFVEKMKVFSQLQTRSELERLHESLSEERELKAKITHLSELRTQGFTALNDVEQFDEAKFKQKHRKSRRKMKRLSSPKRNSMVAKKAEGEVEKLDILIDDDGIKDDEGLVEDSKEMACMPGYDGLSEREKRLCNSIKMVPATYMNIKTRIIEDYLKRKEGVPAKIRFPSGMDRTHRRRILSFLSDNGWIGVM